MSCAPPSWRVYSTISRITVCLGHNGYRNCVKTDPCHCARLAGLTISGSFKGQTASNLIRPCRHKSSIIQAPQTTWRLSLIVLVDQFLAQLPGRMPSMPRYIKADAPPNAAEAGADPVYLQHRDPEFDCCRNSVPGMACRGRDGIVTGRINGRPGSQGVAAI